MLDKNFFNDKTILVTGCCGTIGSELVKQLVYDYGASEIIGIDNNESSLFLTEQEYLNQNASFFLTDIRDEAKLEKLFQDVDIVFHTAAFKHVTMCERSPFEAVQTNIIGVQNVISAARSNNVGLVVFTSSDKAVNPTNVMGTSKLMGERIITAANSNSRHNRSVFISTRFGNVMGSRGSVVPIFLNQIKNGGPVTLTDPEMTRFIMSIKEAVGLVINSVYHPCGGEVFVTKMPVIRIKDLAEVMIEELAPHFGFQPQDIEIKVIGVKPGEKLYEELMTSEEMGRTFELERYFAVKPAFTSLYQESVYDYSNIVSSQVNKPYNSANEEPMGKDELKKFLNDNRLITL